MKLKITLAALLFSTCTIAQDRISKEFSDIEKITMTTSSGDCIIRRSNTSKISVELVHFYGDEYNPIIEKQGNTLRIKEMDNSRQEGWGWGEKSPKWTLTVPDNLSVKFNTGSGDIEVSDLKIELDMNAGSGDVKLANIKGELVSNTGSGDLDIDDFEGDIRTNTGSGDVEMSDAKGDIRMNCGSGDISIRGAEGAISANVGSGEINASNVLIKGESSFNSGSGDVEVALSAAPIADISVNSGSGDAELDYRGNKIEGLITMKANKRNGEIRAPFDFDTSEEIDGYNQTVIKKTKKMGNSPVKINISTGSGTASISE